MSACLADPVLAVAQLRESLEEAADALAKAHLDRLLACEARIETALMNIPTRGLTTEARAIVASEIELARLTLTRCRRLGQALDDFIRLGLAAQGLSRGYGREGAEIAPDLHSVNTTA
jgi:hypothetical protein